MILQLLLPLCLSLIISLACESLVQPRPAPLLLRPRVTLYIHIATWLLLYATAFLVLQRGWLSAGLLNVLHLVIVQSCRSKWSSLREPFLVQDFEYFLDAIRHPRLYVPFFGLGLAIAASTSGFLAFAAFLWWEPSLVSTHGAGSFLTSVAVIAAVGGLLLPFSLRRRPEIMLQPENDLYRLGLISFFWAYGLYPRRAIDPVKTPACFRHPDRQAVTTSSLPNIVIVQSEAFFDPRTWQPALAQDLLGHWDALKASSHAHGELSVPVWGANTVRSETAFLTGLSGSDLGMHQFNPYRQLAKQPVPNLVASLKRLGYRCVAVHPYPATFYCRDQVMPKLGFDEFIDIADFDHSDRNGQYIGDAAVARKVHTLLASATDAPLMVFVITMENHGPLHLETADPAWLQRLPEEISGCLEPKDANTLAVYLRHLRNADHMANELSHSLSQQPRHGLMCWYGDHVPIMEGVYEALGAPSGHSHYLLWSTLPPRSRESIDSEVAEHPTNIENLAERLWQDLALFSQPRDPAESVESHGTEQQRIELQEQR
ncbi:LTA synthase family protein [Halomonas binhaiensis]|uniref:LTA synthase family protein n=1 Tax=Halomonas binhaiensis TaxID=2562282 RepID=A0A856QK63_9GAMM|nr:LTA synthase family protein [Halomonas binhaiensis]QEM80306.2 LTA synthase family protein [Halomonas binhaiensis]